MSRFDPPWRRYAIRMTRDGQELWWTDDGTGQDEAEDWTDWGHEHLVTYVNKADATDHATRHRDYYRARGRRRRIEVRPVYEYPGGRFERTKGPAK